MNINSIFSHIFKSVNFIRKQLSEIKFCTMRTKINKKYKSVGLIRHFSQDGISGVKCTCNIC